MIVLLPLVFLSSTRLEVGYLCDIDGRVGGPCT